MVYEATATEAEPLVVEGFETFDSFYSREYRPMVGLARAMCHDAWMAEDIAQEAMLRAHRRWRTVSRYERPGAWVRRVTINLASSLLRRRLREARALTRVGSRSTHDDISEPDEQVWATLRSLPRRQRAAVALYYLEDLPVSEVAEVLGISESTVRTHLERGRHHLEAALAFTTQPVGESQ